MVDPRFRGHDGIDPRFRPPTRAVSVGGPPSPPVIATRPVVDPTQSRGLAFPFHFVGGRAAISEGVEHIKDGMAQVIGTLRGEYPFEPEFGCDIGRRVFDPVNSAALAQNDIKSALRKWEPRAEVTDIVTDASKSHEGILSIAVGFRMLGELETTQLSVMVERR